MKKILMVLVAVFALVSCGNVVNSVADVYEDGVAKLEAAKTLEEVGEIDAAVKSEVNEVIAKETEEWNEAVDNNSCKEDFDELAKAEVAYAAALEKAKERISSQK